MSCSEFQNQSFCFMTGKACVQPVNLEDSLSHGCCCNSCSAAPSFMLGWKQDRACGACMNLEVHAHTCIPDSKIAVEDNHRDGVAFSSRPWTPTLHTQNSPVLFFLSGWLGLENWKALGQPYWYTNIHTYKAQRGWSQILFSGIHCQGRRQLAQTETQGIPSKHQEVLICCLWLNIGTCCPERLCSLHPWRF